MDVSIILVSYNTEELTKECIKSIYDKTEDVNFNIIVVDNASKDNSCRMIKENFPDVKLIESKVNLGFGGANNLGIKASEAKYVFLLNTDTVLINNAVKILFDYMENPENANIGVSGGQLYNADMTFQGSHGKFEDINFLFKKSLGLNWINRLKRLKNIKTKNQTKSSNEVNKKYTPFETDMILGADMMIRRSALDKAGMFDERFFMYAEEEELCFRIKKHGFKVMLNPEAQIIHYGGGTTSKTNTSIEVEKMRLKSTVLFYEICYGKLIGNLAKFLFLIYYLRYLFLRFFSPKAFQRLFMATNVITSK